MWHLAIVVLYQLSYAADVVSLELYQWKAYSSQGWKRFPRKPALCQLSIGQLGKEQTSLLLLIWIFQFISDSCSNLGDTFYIHILWRALYDLPNDLPNSAQNMWFLTKLIFIGNVDVVQSICCCPLHKIPKKCSATTGFEPAPPWYNATSKLEPAWCSTNWATRLMLWSLNHILSNNNKFSVKALFSISDINTSFLDALASLKPILFTEWVSAFFWIVDNLRIHQWKCDRIVPNHKNQC